MAKYIDADELIEDIKRVYCKDCNNYNEIRCRACGTDDALRMIEDAPTADVVSEIFGEIDDAMIDHARGEIDDHWLYVRIDEIK